MESGRALAVDSNRPFDSNGRLNGREGSPVRMLAEWGNICSSRYALSCRCAFKLFGHLEASCVVLAPGWGTPPPTCTLCDKIPSTPFCP
eukprot:6059564-Pyramimonas_sp.AAC.1